MRAAAGEAWDYSECFAEVAPWFHTADLAVVNHGDTRRPGTTHRFIHASTPLRHLVDALHAAGFGLFLTANNHCLDRHDRGVRHTLNALDSRRLPHTGTYRRPRRTRSLMPPG